MSSRTRKSYGLLDPEMLSNDQPLDAETTDPLEPVTEDDLEDVEDQAYEDGLEDGLELNPGFVDSEPGNAVIRKREDTRSTLAIIYVIATFAVFVLGMFIAVLDGLNREVSIIDNLSEIIPLFSGVFLGTLGFVLGYYFRKGDE